MTSGDNGPRLVPILLGAALVLAWTVCAGGIDPRGRFVTFGLVSVAALVSLRRLNDVPLRLPLFLPAFAAVASLSTALIPGLGFEEIFQFLFLALAANILFAREEDHFFPTSLIFASVALAASIHVEAVGNYMVLGRPGLGLGAAGFLSGAGVSSVALAAALPALWESRARFAQPLFILLTILMVSAIVLTESRTGLVAAALGMSWSFLRMPSQARRLFLLAVAVVLAVATVLFLPRFIDRLDPGYLTNAQRLSMLRGVGRAFLARPLLGHGPWSFPLLGQSWLSWPKWELHPHSLFLRVAFESGLIGLLAWLSLLAAAFSGAVRGTRATWAPGVMLAVLGGSMTDDMFWIPMLAFVFLAAAATSVAASPYALSTRAASSLLIVSGFTAALLPVLHDIQPGLPFAPLSQELDECVAENRVPTYRGAEHDPFALRISGYAHLARGDTPRAIASFQRAEAIDPRLILGPHTLDLAWTYRADGQVGEAGRMVERTRAIAPVLAAWYLRDSRPVEPSFVDRHYGIEYPDPLAITASMVRPDGDLLSWRHYRYEGARSLLEGDRTGARRWLEKAHLLALQQYGTDAVLCRLYAEAAPEFAAELNKRAELRRDPALPYRVFAPLVYRHRIFSGGDNSPWWRRSP